MLPPVMQQSVLLTFLHPFDVLLENGSALKCRTATIQRSWRGWWSPHGLQIPSTTANSSRHFFAKCFFITREVLPQSVRKNDQRETLQTHDALDKLQSHSNQLVTIIRDENATEVQLDIVALLLGLKQFEGCETWRCHHRMEFERPSRLKSFTPSR